MTQEMTKHLYGKYRKICNEYVRIFCEKYGFHFEPDCWVGEKVGELAQIDVDIFANFNDIVTDINEAKDRKEYFAWDAYNDSVLEFRLNRMNYSSWLKGAPRVPHDVIRKLYEQRKELQDTIDKYRNEYKEKEEI